MSRTLLQTRRQAFLAIAIFALAIRILIPSGWMPSADLGHATITLCTDQGVVEAWVDANGEIHKTAPRKGGKPAGDCVFTGLAVAAVGAPETDALPPQPAAATIVVFPASAVGVGHGLAAPPPPARGPPHLI